MSDKNNGMRHSPKSVYTLIGTGMRIDGNIACTGVLRVQGDILGNVSCADESTGSVIVDSAGSVTGAVDAGHVEVRGRIVGPVRSNRSVEIHQGGSLSGDVSFRTLAIHAGGIVDGLLDPVPAAVNDALAEPPRPAAKTPPPDAPSPKLAGGMRRIAFGALALAAFAIAAWAGLHRGGRTSPAEEAGLRPDETLAAAAAAPAAAPLPAPPATEPQEAAPAAPVEASAAEPAAAAAPPEPAPPPPAAAEAQARTDERILAVRGTNPNRPPGVFLLISNSPSVLFRKKRDEPGDGDRITVPAGEKASVAVAPNELIRVAQGHDVVILYQGRKVPRDTIESGAWISFVPR
ncbi:MAG TPA: polymer-forming cytoskeletal protein [Rhodocyclaceae bacterium]